MPKLFPKLRFGFIEATAQWLPLVAADLKRRAGVVGADWKSNVLEANRFYVTCQTDDDLAYITGIKEFFGLGLQVDARVLDAFAGIAAVALENGQLAERIKKEALARSNFERFFTPTLAARIASSPDAVKLGGDKRRVAVLFSDIRGFTAMTDWTVQFGCILMSSFWPSRDTTVKVSPLSASTVPRTRTFCGAGCWANAGTVSAVATIAARKALANFSIFDLPYEFGPGLDTAPVVQPKCRSDIGRARRRLPAEWRAWPPSKSCLALSFRLTRS